MNTIVAQQVTYVPFKCIVLNDNTFRFRLENQERKRTLREEMERRGQLTPLVLEEVAPEQYRVLDGYLRCDAVADILATGGTWDKLLAHWVPQESLTLQDKLRLLWEKNTEGEFPYGLYEKGCFFRTFSQNGLSLAEMSRCCALSPHEIEDHMELTLVEPSLANDLNDSPIDVLFAAMLVRRYRAWLKSPYQAWANGVARSLLGHAAREEMTMKSWKFLLNFYWFGKRPFMAPRT